MHPLPSKLCCLSPIPKSNTTLKLFPDHSTNSSSKIISRRKTCNTSSCSSEPKSSKSKWGSYKYSQRLCKRKGKSRIDLQSKHGKGKKKSSSNLNKSNAIYKDITRNLIKSLEEVAKTFSLALKNQSKIWCRCIKEMKNGFEKALILKGKSW